MIAINLLRRTLVNEQRQRRRCQGEAAIVLLIVMGTVVVCGFIWADLDRSRGQLQKEKEHKSEQLVVLERTRGQLEVIHRHTADLKKRSQQVTRLMGQQRRSIRLLDSVIRSLDPLNLWLAGLEMEQDQVTLKGFADSKSHIVQFAQSLKRDGLFQDVTVLEAGKTSGESSVYHFTMNLLLISEVDHVTSS
jgi:Tfp pilus assembly protein PilN